MAQENRKFEKKNKMVVSLEGPSPDRKRFPRAMSFEDMLEKYPEENPPLIDGILRRGEICNLVGPAKAKKSWMTGDLALSAATGRPWLDRFAVVQSRVLYIDAELQPPTLTRRLARIAEARMIPVEAIQGRLDVVSLRGQNRDIDYIAKQIEELGSNADIVIVDALYRVLPEGTDENSNSAMTKVFNAVDSAASKADTAVIIVHHTTKGDQSRKNVTDIGSGAGAMSRAADCHLTFREHKEHGAVVLDAELRSWQPFESCVLRWHFPLWDIDPSLSALDLRTANSPSGKQREAEYQSVLHALADGYRSLNKIQGTVGFGKEKVKRHLLHGVKVGTVIEIPAGRFIEYQLAT